VTVSLSMDPCVVVGGGRCDLQPLVEAMRGVGGIQVVGWVEKKGGRGRQRDVKREYPLWSVSVNSCGSLLMPREWLNFEDEFTEPIRSHSIAVYLV
jgi:hypothetical protein